jgi:large subunit ribosomal protein L15
VRLNTLHPHRGSKQSRRRVGRGAGSGMGKTSGRGHKGLKSRSGGSVKAGFEGGQMPLQRRIPKFGFRSRIGLVSAKIRLGELAKIEGDVVDLEALRRAGLIQRNIKRARIFLSGAIERPVTVRGIGVSKGAREAIEAAGGKIEESSSTNPVQADESAKEE